MEKVTMTMIWGTEAVKGVERPEEGHTKKTYAFLGSTLMLSVGV